LTKNVIPSVLFYSRYDLLPSRQINYRLTREWSARNGLYLIFVCTVRFIDRQETDPYFNLAAEEYFFKCYDDEFFMLWRNDRSVIIGKHQNPYAEVNMAYATAHGIPVIRRISGGGTVFHDAGNLNYTFIVYGEKGRLVDYPMRMAPIIEFLQGLGLPVQLSGRSDITLRGLKISGNAEHVYRDKVLHHGTLLFSTDVKEMEAVLTPGEEYFPGHAMRSKRSMVTTISKHLSKAMDMDALRKALMDFIFTRETGNRMVTMTARDTEKIRALMRTKYLTHEWNFSHYSPKAGYDE
jgi:lipoate-protein ligase A